MKELIIDSFLRTNGTNENFNVVIPYCREIKLLEAYIPMSYFNVNGGSFTISGTSSGLSTFIIPSGKYTQTCLAKYIQSLLDAQKPGFGYVVGVDLVDRFNITSNETFTADFTLFEYLGFEGTQPATTSITGNSTTTILNFPYILIKSSNILGVDNGPILSGNSNILHVVPTCSGKALDYRTSDSTPWFKIITAGYTATINMNFSIYANGFSFNNARWVIKVLIR